MPCHKGHDALLEPLEVVVRLRCGDHSPAHAYRMDGHGGGWHGKTVLSRYCQRHADRVAPPQNNGDRGLGHAGDQLRDGKSRLHIAAHRVEQKQHPVHLVALLQLGKQRQDVLIFGGLSCVGRGGMALNLADDG